MPRLRSYILLLLPFLVVMAIYVSQSTRRKPAAKQVSGTCTLGHYQPRARLLAMPGDLHHAHDGKHKKGHKSSVQRVVFKVLLPDTYMQMQPDYSSSERPAARLPKIYAYLFFQEINPPPPKAC